MTADKTVPQSPGRLSRTQRGWAVAVLTLIGVVGCGGEDSPYGKPYTASCPGMKVKYAGTGEATCELPCAPTTTADLGDCPPGLTQFPAHDTRCYCARQGVSDRR
jgi:hypothetical protein